jgi:hypothetical protein
MVKIILVIVLTFSINELLTAQENNSKRIECDSTLKTKIESVVMFSLSGRMVKTLIKPDNNTCEIGQFSVDIIVNRNGQVINAEFNTKVSSAVSDSLKLNLLDAARRSRFMDANDSPAKQKGSITYVFRMQGDNK